MFGGIEAKLTELKRQGKTAVLPVNEIEVHAIFAVADMGASLLVVFNGLRLLRR